MSLDDSICEEVAARLADADTAGPLDAATQAHLAGCPDCRALASARPLVRGRLRSLAEAPAPAPPAELEARLRARLAERVPAGVAGPSVPRQDRRGRRPGALRWIAAAAGVAALATGAHLLSPEPGPSAPTAGTTPSAGPVASETAAELRPPADRASAAAGQRFRALGLLESERPLEARRLARVEMAAEVAVYLGWPLGPEPPGARVQADILYGEDGVARAVRFLPATFRVPAGKEDSR